MTLMFQGGVAFVRLTRARSVLAVGGAGEQPVELDAGFVTAGVGETLEPAAAPTTVMPSIGRGTSASLRTQIGAFDHQQQSWEARSLITRSGRSRSVDQMMRVVRRVYPANEDTEHQRDGQQDQREHGELAEGAAHELICFTPMNLVARRPIGEPTRRRRHVFPASKDSRCGAEEHGSDTEAKYPVETLC